MVLLHALYPLLRRERRGVTPEERAQFEELQQEYSRLDDCLIHYPELRWIAAVEKLVGDLLSWVDQAHGAFSA